MQASFSVKGRLVDIKSKKIHQATVVVTKGMIEKIEPSSEPADALPFIVPGFIDSHVHIESSMLIPAQFARLAVVHGTVGTVSDPHEIANVCGIEGVEYMIRNGATVPFKFNFGAPSCVPATTFETAGASITVTEVKTLLARKEIRYLSEMMNFPGVLTADPEVLAKIDAARAVGKPVDGHAPGLEGDEAGRYINAGISTDHECFTREEAAHKLSLGMQILIREGSAAKNFEALIDLLHDHEDAIMFCSDDKHPDSLVDGHINSLCARAIARGIDLFKVLKAACINPVEHYKLDIGQLKAGDPADFILLEDLKEFKVKSTYINGILVASKGQSYIRTDASKPAEQINQFSCASVGPGDFELQDNDDDYAIYSNNIIEAYDGQLITGKTNGQLLRKRGYIHANPDLDLLKIVVVNRYSKAAPAIAFIKGFGFRQGAIASSVAHDSHNIVAIGGDDMAISAAVNLVINARGGISCVRDDSDAEQQVIELPVAGLMSDGNGYEVASAYIAIDAMAKSLGCKLASPFMTLSFMALLVIPQLKLSDLGLFDGAHFRFIR